MFMNFNILFKYNQIKHELLLSSPPNLSGCPRQSTDLAGQWWPPWPPWGHGCRWGRKWSLKCHSWPLVCLPRRTAHLHPARDSQRNSTTFLPWCPPSRPQAQGTSPGMCTWAGPLHLQVPSRGCLGKILELERERTSLKLRAHRGSWGPESFTGRRWEPRAWKQAALPGVLPTEFWFFVCFSVCVFKL